MIIKALNNCVMKLHAGCYWGEWCDVGIIQEWDHPQRGREISYIEMTANEAEQLITELQTAIARARELDAGYFESMKEVRDES